LKVKVKFIQQILYREANTWVLGCWVLGVGLWRIGS